MRRLEALIKSISDGDAAALKELYEKTKGGLYGYALSLLKNPDDAEDVLQDCFVQVYTRAGTYQPRGKPMAWLVTIVRNLCLMKLNERSRTADLPDSREELPVEDERIGNAADRMLLEAVLYQLPEQEREILLLHLLLGYKHREIAQSMQLPLSTVLSKYSRSLKKIRKRMREIQNTGGGRA